MVEEQLQAPGQPAGARPASWLSAMFRGHEVRSAYLAPDDDAVFVQEAEDRLGEAAEALGRLAASSRAMLEAVEGSALPALDQAIAAAAAMAGDKRMAVSTRRRLMDLKATVEAARAELAAMAGASAPRAEPEPEPVAPPVAREPRKAAARQVEAYPIPAPAFRPAGEPASAGMAGRTETPAHATGAPRVLVGEANGVHQLQLRTLLAQLDIEPHFVADAGQLIEAWRGEAWNLILVDIASPAFGLDAASTIRETEANFGWACTPIVALGERPPQDADGVIDSHVAKPLAGPSLGDAIERALAAAPKILRIGDENFLSPKFSMTRVA